MKLSDRFWDALSLVCMILFFSLFVLLVGYKEDAVFLKGDCYTHGVHRVIYPDHIRNKCFDTYEEAEDDLARFNLFVRKSEDAEKDWVKIKNKKRH